MKEKQVKKIINSIRKEQPKADRIKQMIKNNIDINDEIKILRETLRKVIDKIGYEGFEEFLKYDESIRSVKDKIK